MDAAGFVKGGCQERGCKNRDGQPPSCGKALRHAPAWCFRAADRSAALSTPDPQGPPPAPAVEKRRAQWPGSPPSAADPRLLISVAPALKQPSSSFLANHDLAQPIAARRPRATMSLQAHNSICNAHGRTHQTAPTTALLAPQRRRREPMTARIRCRAWVPLAAALYAHPSARRPRSPCIGQHTSRIGTSRLCCAASRPIIRAWIQRPLPPPGCLTSILSVAE